MRRVLCVGPLMPQLEQQLEAQHRAAFLKNPSIQGWKELTNEFRSVDTVTVAVTSGRTGVPAWVMDRLPRLGAIVNFGVGYDATDISAAEQRGIAVANTPDVLTECVADTALGLVLATLRRLPAADAFLRQGRWEAGESFPLTWKVSGRRFGILGLGRIGQATATRLEGFGATIGYHNRNRRADSPYTYYSSAEALAEASDVLIITASGGPASQGLVHRRALQALGPAGFLINVGRGSIVDEDALISALQAGEIAGAGLDTFAQEPAVPQALMERDDVVLLPHIASGTVETRQAMADLVTQNVEQFLITGKLLTPVRA